MNYFLTNLSTEYQCIIFEKLKLKRLRILELKYYIYSFRMFFGNEYVSQI